MAKNDHIAAGLRRLAVPIESLNADVGNVRTHDERNIEAIKSSLARFGQRQPVVVQKQGMIVRAGNGRLEAAKALGWETLAAVVVDESAVDAAAFAIADNRTAELAEWDEDALAKVLAGMDAEGGDLTGLGFDDDEIAELMDMLNEEPDPDPDDVEEDEVPEPPADPVTKPGQLWQLGRHRLLCGDATSEADLDKVTGGSSVDVTLTDPPYGVDLAYDSHEDTQAALAELARVFFPLVLERSEVVALTPGNCNVGMYPPPPWVLGWFFSGRSMTTWGFNCWQPVLVYGPDPFLAVGDGCRPDAIVMNSVVQGEDRPDHPCPKPAKFWAWLMERVGHKKKTFLDPFAGSGTSIVVAQQLNRTCYAIEKDPRYCDVIVQRWENLTGETAELIDDEEQRNRPRSRRRKTNEANA